MKEKLFTKDQLEKLLNTDSIAEKDKLISELENRVDYIIRDVFFKCCKTDGWWAWESYEGDGEPPPFSKDMVHQDINLLDVYLNPDKWPTHNGYYYNGNEWGIFDGGISLDWLWLENVKEIFVEGYREYKDIKITEKEKKKLRKIELEQKKKEFRASAMKKLTPAEKWACGLSKKIPKTV